MSDDLIALGPGKVDLLESIDKAGSISEAARQGHISYRRAWDMVDAMNQCFKKPLVESVTGGKGGGGAALTPLGKKVIEIYRDMEKKYHDRIHHHFDEGKYHRKTFFAQNLFEFF